MLCFQRNLLILNRYLLIMEGIITSNIFQLVLLTELCLHILVFDIREIAQHLYLFHKNVHTKTVIPIYKSVSIYDYSICKSLMNLINILFFHPPIFCKFESIFSGSFDNIYWSIPSMPRIRLIQCERKKQQMDLGINKTSL